MVVYSIVYNIVQQCIVYGSVQYSIWYSVVVYSIVYGIVQQCIVYNIVQQCIVQYMVQCSVVCTVLFMCIMWYSIQCVVVYSVIYSQYVVYHIVFHCYTQCSIVVYIVCIQCISIPNYIVTLYQALPLFLACRPKPPVKSAQCKIVLDTDTHPAQPLTELFGDLLYAYQSAGKHSFFYFIVWYSSYCMVLCLLLY